MKYSLFELNIDDAIGCTTEFYTRDILKWKLTNFSLAQKVQGHEDMERFPFSKWDVLCFVVKSFEHAHIKILDLPLYM